MDYWSSRRIRERERLLDTSIAQLELSLQRRYLNTANRIIKELTTLYDDITIGSVTISRIYNYQHYYEILTKIQEEITNLGSAEVRQFERNLSALYKANYKLIGKQYGFSGTWNKDVIKTVLYTDWVGDGKNFSDRIWKHKEDLMNFLQQGLFDSIAMGTSSEDLTKKLMDKFSVSYSDASRLARTEMSYCYNQSALDRYKDAGVKEYKIIAEKNERTCEYCKTMDGRRYSVEGENVLPPFH